MTTPIRFGDASAYERYMGTWSQLVAQSFLSWLSLKPALCCLDIGCGNGAFAATLIQRARANAVKGCVPL